MTQKERRSAVVYKHAIVCAGTIEEVCDSFVRKVRQTSSSCAICEYYITVGLNHEVLYDARVVRDPRADDVKNGGAAVDSDREGIGGGRRECDIINPHTREADRDVGRV